MRVALVSPYALSAFGGVQEQVLGQSRALLALGHDVLVVCPDVEDERSYDTGATVQRFGRLVRVPANGSQAPLTLSPRASRRAKEAIEAFDPQVVHFHEPFAPLVGWATLRAHVRPSVGTFHRSGAGPAITFSRPLLRRWAQRLDVVTAVSEAAAATMGAAAGVAPTVLFNGFELDRFRAFDRQVNETPLLVTIGRLEERKGTSVAIEAVRAHNARGGTPWRLVVIGDGPERARLEALAGHDEAIEFVGALGDDEKRRWLRRADALLCPALRGESFGLVVLEGMASETAVVASDINGYRQAAGGHASLAPPGDSIALEAATIRALATDAPTRQRAREHAEEWSMTKLARLYVDLYEEATRRFSATR